MARAWQPCTSSVPPPCRVHQCPCALPGGRQRLPLHSAHSLSPLHRPSRSLPLARRGRHGSRRRAPRPPPSARLWREPRASAPSPSPAVHVEPLSHLPPSPVLLVLGAADVAAASCRGRTATSYLRPSRVALWVRAGPLVLHRHFPDAGMAPNGRSRELRRPPLLRFTWRTSRSNSRKGRVPSAKSVTQRNSADKDLFAVNLLNLWKFIVIHTKFVK